MADEEPQSRGHLNPGSPGVRFDRFELGPGLRDLVRHVWVVRWSIEAGARVQRVLSYPAVNVVFEPGRAGLYGPDPRVDVRVLEGESWAVGILFRPAAGRLVSEADAVRLVGRGEKLAGAPAGDVERAMRQSPECARGMLVGILRAWLLPVAEGVDERGVLLNEICRLAEEDAEITRVADLAERAGVSSRTLERLVKDGIGVTPKWLIECRRLQQAASSLYTDPLADLTDLAAELGYADYAHFSRRYKAVLDETPEQTRRAGIEAAVERGAHGT